MYSSSIPSCTASLKEAWMQVLHKFKFGCTYHEFVMVRICDTDPDWKKDRAFCATIHNHAKASKANMLTWYYHYSVSVVMNRFTAIVHR